MKPIFEPWNLLSITCQYKSTSKPNEKYGTTMVWILLFISVKIVFSLYTHPAAKKNSGIWKEYLNDWNRYALSQQGQYLCLLIHQSKINALLSRFYSSFLICQYYFISYLSFNDSTTNRVNIQLSI